MRLTKPHHVNRGDRLPRPTRPSRLGVCRGVGPRGGRGAFASRKRPWPSGEASSSSIACRGCIRTRVDAPRTVTDEAVEALIVKTLGTTPAGETHWSTRSMAKVVGISHTMVGRIWRTLRPQPHRTESFKLSPDHNWLRRSVTSSDPI
jgi:hypothetical protein